MNKYWTVKAFSKIVGTTVRTLHYYDKQGILSPCYTNEAGYRFYSNNEYLSFKKIAVLKYMGFSLKQIKETILNDNVNWSHFLNLQFETIKETMETFKYKQILINDSLNYYNKCNEIDFSNMFELIKNFPDNKIIYETHVTDQSISKSIHPWRCYKNNNLD